MGCYNSCMPQQTRRAVLAGAATIGLAGCTGFDDADAVSETTELSYQVPETLVVSNEVGAVTVSGTQRDDVAVTLNREGPADQLDRLSFSGDRTDGQLTLTGQLSDGDLLRTDSELSLNIEIKIPRAVVVDRVETVAGDVRLSDVSGNPTVKSTVGAVTIREVDGYISADTTTDDVTIRAVEGIADITTTTGSIAADVADLPTDATVETTTGEIDLAVSRSLDAELSVEVGTGDLTVSDLPLDVSETTTGATAHGTLGKSDATLDVLTETGSVSLQPLTE